MLGFLGLKHVLGRPLQLLTWDYIQCFIQDSGYSYAIKFLINSLARGKVHGSWITFLGIKMQKLSFILIVFGKKIGWLGWVAALPLRWLSSAARMVSTVGAAGQTISFGCAGCKVHGAVPSEQFNNEISFLDNARQVLIICRIKTKLNTYLKSLGKVTLEFQ